MFIEAKLRAICAFSVLRPVVASHQCGESRFAVVLGVHDKDLFGVDASEINAFRLISARMGTRGTDR